MAEDLINEITAIKCHNPYTTKNQMRSLKANIETFEKIEQEYGSLEKWGELTSGKEPNAKAVIFGFTQMLNEGIDIENEDKGTNEPFLTIKQVGRMITEVGMDVASSALQETVIDSTKSSEKNL